MAAYSRCRREGWLERGDWQPGRAIEAVLLGVAQVVVNVPDIAAAADRLEAAGYQRTFAAAIPNHPAKRELQASRRERLDMVHLAAPSGGMALELTSYSDGEPQGAAAFELHLPERAGGRTRVVAPVADRELSERFWCGQLGFTKASADGTNLTSPARRAEWALDVTLAEPSGPRRRTAVDADGCVLVTVLTSDIDGDAARLAQDVMTSRMAPPWDEEVDGRSLRVAMVEGPSGELIELLQLPRRPQSTS